MKTMSLAIPVAVIAFAVSSLALAQAPAGSTGECKDGSYTSTPTKRGACRGHGGVKEWFASDKSEAKESKSKKSEAKSAKTETMSHDKGAMAAPAAGAMAAPSEGSMSKSSGSTASSPKMSSSMRATAAPGGGAGKVWVNESTHVYHCAGDRWYGKTKEGEYMSEADAKAKGAHASRGKACS